MQNPQTAEAPKHPYIRPQEKIELQADIDSCDHQLNETDKNFRVEDRNTVLRRRDRLKAQMMDNSAPEVSSTERDALIKEGDAIAAIITDSAPSFDEMRKNPPGTVGKNIQHHRRTKGMGLRWKAIQQIVHPDSDDPDLCNLERLRLESRRDVNYQGSQIGGEVSYSMPSPQYMQNHAQMHWDDTPASESAESEVSQANVTLLDVVKRQSSVINRLEAKLDEITKDKLDVVTKKKARVKAERTPEQVQAAKDRMAVARASRGKNKKSELQQEAELSDTLRSEATNPSETPEPDAAS